MENSSTYTSGSGNRMITGVTGVRVASMTITTAANENNSVTKQESTREMGKM